MGLVFTILFNSFSERTALRRQNLTSRCQILTSEDGPRPERPMKTCMDVRALTGTMVDYFKSKRGA